MSESTTLENPDTDHLDLKKVDTEEFKLPETLFIRDIENRVFQSMILECLSRIDGIGLIEGNFIDNLLGRKENERVTGILAEQDEKKHSVGVKVEINIRYGVSIPKKADEIQEKIIHTIHEFSGLHVSYVHVIFKNILSEKQTPAALIEQNQATTTDHSDEV